MCEVPSGGGAWLRAIALFVVVLPTGALVFPRSEPGAKPRSYFPKTAKKKNPDGVWGNRKVGCAYHKSDQVDEQKRTTELSAKLRSQLVGDCDVQSALRVLENATGGSRSFEKVLKNLVPDEAMIRRIVDAATVAPARALPAAARSASFEGCVDLMVSERWLDAQDALEQFANDENMAIACRVLEAICKHELGCPEDLEAIIAVDNEDRSPLKTHVDDLSAPVRDLGLAVAAYQAGEAKVAYGHALACAATVSSSPHAETPALVALRTLARRTVEKADALLEREQQLAAWQEAVVEVDEEEDEANREARDMRERAGDSDAMHQLLDLIGLKAIKRECLNIKEAIELDVERGDDPRDKQHSVVFTGNSGTGKTTVGRLYSELLRELGVLAGGNETDPKLKKHTFVEISGSKLVLAGPAEFQKLLDANFEDDGKSKLKIGDKVQVPSRRGTTVGEVCYLDPSGTYDVHFGQSVEIKVKRDTIRALDRIGGTLFVDEAYQLDPKSNQVGRQILDMLTAEMDDKGGRLVVILAGYPKRVDDMLSEHNEGALRTRFRKTFHFPDFEDDELAEIMRREFALKKSKYHVVDDKYVRIATRRLGKLRGSHGFGNARAVQHAVDAASDRQTARVLKHRREKKAAEEEGLVDLDIFEFTREDLLGERSLLESRKNSPALADLNALWGLDAVKDSVDRLLRMVETNVEREELELPIQDVSLNRVFLGNPGTGKTTVARVYGRILNELGLLSKGDVIMTNPSDFVGGALGQSEQQTNAILDKSKGCVLVIDEAYGLHPSPDGRGAHADPYKTAVVDTIVSRVQGVAGDDRCVLLLGYKRQMEDFVRNANPGLQRRFQLENAFVFEDYDDDALFRILMRKAKSRGRPVSFDAAKTAVRKKLAKERMRPNFGNAGTVDNMLSSAIAKSEERLSALPPDQRATETELVESDFYVEPPHYADPEKYVFEGLIGCDVIREKLREYRAVVSAAREQGRDPLDDLPLNFCFVGSPGTGKTTVARRMGLLFESLGVLPSSEVYQCSASDFSTGFVGQAARKTREEFEKARGAVLFVDEAYRLYDPTSRSYMQEACDEIVNILTEDEFRGKMVVIFAGYPEPMRQMLDHVNPGLKSRVAEIINFPDFDADATTEMLELRFKEKRFDLADDAVSSVRRAAAKLVAAPRWANGRDVETYAKRVASECAKRRTRVVTPEILDVSLEPFLEREYSDAPKPPTIPTDYYPVATDTIRPFETATITVTKEEIEVEEVEPLHLVDGSAAGALEEACVALGYDESTASRELLVGQLEAGDIPEDVVAYVADKIRAASKPAVVELLRPELPTLLAALKAKIQYDRDREIELARMKESDRQREIQREKAVQTKLRRMGKCPAGFEWRREGCGWRCGGGSHYVADDDPALEGI
ncbi:hypothetical protein CTAYLR_000826 [Chrysophaeum taylorii]|uniref:AAA+ ATPase domain-containing protein n=1 Tax=Chrysophaeum taylorii TaxID=2483200 RepID=A0AAD7XUW8_9STRA|nr:hypothetical protein CTAYLR_000826 [Chrysophaeum taylorii]